MYTVKQNESKKIYSVFAHMKKKTSIFSLFVYR